MFFTPVACQSALRMDRELLLLWYITTLNPCLMSISKTFVKGPNYRKYIDKS